MGSMTNSLSIFYTLVPSRLEVMLSSYTERAAPDELYLGRVRTLSVSRIETWRCGLAHLQWLTASNTAPLTQQVECGINVEGALARPCSWSPCVPCKACPKCAARLNSLPASRKKPWRTGGFHLQALFMHHRWAIRAAKTLFNTAFRFISSSYLRNSESRRPLRGYTHGLGGLVLARSVPFLGVSVVTGNRNY